MSKVPEAPVAVLAVSDKRGIEALAQTLTRRGWRLYGTSGTAAVLEAGGVPVLDIEALTNAPARFGGRVKTLNEDIFGGILFRREEEDDSREARRLGLPRIDLVACNFYPFARMAEGNSKTSGELLSFIDIGGPAMVRAAAKNHDAVLALVDPEDYPRVIEMLQAGEPPYGALDVRERRRLAAKAFRATEQYDVAIASYLEADCTDAIC